MSKSYIRVLVDKDDLVSSLRSIAAAFMAIADEMQEEISPPWQPMSTALKNGKTILVRVAGGDHEPFCAYYDLQSDMWRESFDHEALNPKDYVGPLEWRHLS